MSNLPADPESKLPAPVVTQPEPVPPAPVGGVEIGGREGPDPTRFGDWEKNGRCIDF